MLSSGYDLLTPPRIAFGWGRRHELGALAKDLGTRAFLIYGARRLVDRGVLDALTRSLADASVEPIVVGSIHREPEVTDVDEQTTALRRHDLRSGDFVVAVGGGAALDLAKATAAMATQPDAGSVRDFLEGVGSGRTLETAPLPLVALPTTAGTGSEATKNAVISHYDPNFKKSLRSDHMVPRLALIDPELHVSVPPETTAYTGMDAITQLIESYVSCRARPLPQALAIEGLRSALPAIGTAVSNGDHRAAREGMAHAALLSGIALANSGLGMAHGVAAALGTQCRVPHGLACAVMLPVALRTNRDAALEPLADLGEQLLEGESFTSRAAAADAFVECIDALCEAVAIPRTLTSLGVGPDDIPALVAGSRGNSMNGNPRALSDAELETILTGMLAEPPR